MLLNTSGGGRLCGYTTKDQCVVQFVQQQHFGYWKIKVLLKVL